MARAIAGGTEHGYSSRAVAAVADGLQTGRTPGSTAPLLP